MRQKIGLIGAPLLAILLWSLPAPPGLNPAGHTAAAITILMGWLWITEGIPIPATALLPLALFPLLGITDTATVAASYGNRAIFLFMGGFFIATALETWNLHQRLALQVLRKLGTRPRRLIWGFLYTSAALSMWISNTATVLMMFPLAMAILKSIEENGEVGAGFRSAGMLAMAYGASVGGMATVIGTPPNIVFTGLSSTLYPGAPEVTFVQWLAVGGPIVMVFLPCVAVVLIRMFRIKKGGVELGRDIIDSRLRQLGPMRSPERWVLAIFLLAAFGWIFRRTTDFGLMTVPGWSNLLGVADTVDDSTVAMVAALLLFAIPVNWKTGERLLTWERAKTIPWGILVLFGGGIAIAAGFRETGLSQWVGIQLAGIDAGHPLLLIGSVCGVMTFLTEITSNTATATIFLPIVASMAVSLGQHPHLLMIPATLSASCAFMLPVATPTNAVVFGSGHISIIDMVKVGFILNVIGVILIPLIFYAISLPVLHIDPGVLPAWAIPQP